MMMMPTYFSGYDMPADQCDQMMRAPRRQDAPSNMHVYAPGFKAVLSIPATEVRHLPPPQLNVTRLVLCANYDPRNPEGSCPMGARCKFVHADATACPQHEIHVNYAWRSLDECIYERFTPGQVLHVAAPNSKLTGDVMDSQLALKTKALESTRRPLSHCAHYYFNRTCNLGGDCRFIHAVFIDPNAKEHQRAPAPTQLGREHHHHMYRQQRAAARMKRAGNDMEGHPDEQGAIGEPIDAITPEFHHTPQRSNNSDVQPLQLGRESPAGGAPNWMPGRDGRATSGTNSLATTPRQSPAHRPAMPPMLSNDPADYDIQSAADAAEANRQQALSRSPIAQALSTAAKQQQQQQQLLQQENAATTVHASG
jgi:hypothetical protein